MMGHYLGPVFELVGFVGSGEELVVMRDYLGPVSGSGGDSWA
jgi:hypothetical protein